jgi:hypothetical protein
VAIHRAYPSVSLVYTNSVAINENDEVMKFGGESVPDRYRIDYFNKGLNECKEFLSQANIIPNASSVVFKALYLRQIDFKLINYKMVGDWIIYFKVLCLSDIYFIADELNYYRTHQNNVRSKLLINKGINEIVSVLDYAIKNNLVNANVAD